MKDNAVWAVLCPRVFYNGNETGNSFPKVFTREKDFIYLDNILIITIKIAPTTANLIHSVPMKISEFPLTTPVLFPSLWTFWDSFGTSNILFVVHQAMDTWMS